MGLPFRALLPCVIAGLAASGCHAAHLQSPPAPVAVVPVPSAPAVAPRAHRPPTDEDVLRRQVDARW
ncbi:MAG TPA: hypothetical protein VIF09_20960, partial [Polyangiaceae bacterium]